MRTTATRRIGQIFAVAATGGLVLAGCNDTMDDTTTENGDPAVEAPAETGQMDDGTGMNGGMDDGTGMNGGMDDGAGMNGGMDDGMNDGME